MKRRVIAMLAAACALAGCQNKALITSIQNGESKVFERPPYEVRGQTTYDQNWIDNQVEGGVAAFGWDRPAPRPPEIDALPPPKVVATPPKKKKLWERVKSKFKKKPIQPVVQSLVVRPASDTPFPQSSVAPVVAPPTPDLPPAAKPTIRDRVEELLHPSAEQN